MYIHSLKGTQRGQLCGLHTVRGNTLPGGWGQGPARAGTGAYGDSKLATMQTPEGPGRPRKAARPQREVDLLSSQAHESWRNT